MIPGIGSPKEILECIELGIDLFNTNYPSILTELGYALIFSLNPLNSDSKQENLKRQISINHDKDYFIDKMKINLRDKIYQLDKQPLLKDCQCYSCLNHTKSYIHHLLNTHELLANILLNM